MRKNISSVLIIFILISSLFAIPTAHAKKIGVACKKLNTKSWDGDQPTVCKKNSKGKLVWTRFGSTTTTTAPPTQKKYEFKITLMKINSTFLSTHPDAVKSCDFGKYPDISATTGVEIRDGSGNLLATAVLGTPRVIDAGGSIELGSCVYSPVIQVKKSDFYQIKIGKRYDKSYSFIEIVNLNWSIALTI